MPAGEASTKDNPRERTSEMFPKILPTDRSGWSPFEERLALELYATNATDRAAAAALRLLYRDPARTLFRPEVSEVCFHTVPSEGPAWHIDWERLHSAAEAGRLPSAFGRPEVRALVMLACSLASENCAVRLGPVIAALDPTCRELFLDAVAFAAGVTR